MPPALRRPPTLPLLLLVSLAVPASAAAQVVSQSDLDSDHVDPAFELTLEHLSMDLRWLGVPPRDLRWSPDGEHVYFRWHPDPGPDQDPELDPWYAATPDGSGVERVPDDETFRIPSGTVAWSADRSVAAWASDGVLYVWTAGGGVRPVYTNDEGVGSVRVAADGGRVFFATRGLGSSIESTEQESADLWAYELAGGAVHRIARAVEAPEEEEEPDAWLREQQLELLEVLGERRRERELADSIRRARRPVTTQPIPVEEGAIVRDLQLSPDGEHVTFRWIEEPSGDHRTYYFDYVDGSGEASPRRARPKVVRPLPEHRMGIVRVDPSVPADSVEIEWVEDGTDRETIVHGPYWNPQGTAAVVQILSMDHKDKWIARLDPESGETEVIHHERQEAWIGGPLNGGRWRPGYLQWLPDGERFGFVSVESGWAMLHLAEPGGRVRQLTDGEWEVRGAELSPDGEHWHLVTSREHPGEEHLYRLPATGGELERVTTGEGIHRPVVSPDGRHVATTFETPLRIPDLYVLENRPGAEKTRVTRSGTDDYHRYDWAPSEIVTFPDREGEETWGEVWAPPARANGAAVIYAHGCGECAQAVDRGWTRVRSVLYANYLRQRGYVAASIDYRGSSGYGHENRTYAYRQMGISDIDSGLPLLDLLAGEYDVDRGRIGVYGGSYGGFYTLMSLFRHPGEYAAGVALYPVTDWAHYNQGYTSRILNGSPLDDPEAYRISSPIYHADGLEDPLQIQHGVVDGNVQIQDVFRLTQRLIEHDKPFDLAVYPVEDHGWDESSSRRDSYRRMTEWFDRHLLDLRQRAEAGGGEGGS